MTRSTHNAARSTGKANRFALVDCNNFFASCERVFRPDLKNVPVLVLSNNDGCVIARSNECKTLGIKMGEPYFKCKHLVPKHNIQVFSSNFTLYGDISQRVMQTLEYLCPQVEVYSIDEAFLHLTSLRKTTARQEGDEHEFETMAQNIRNTVHQWTGMPISVGLASTKTRAKIANHLAKKKVEFNNVCDLETLLDEDFYLKEFAVGDIWGVGRQYEKMLQKNKIFSAYDLKNCSETWVKKNMSIVGKRMLMELRGTSCLEMQKEASKKGILCSRSFSHRITDGTELFRYLSSYVARAAEKLRAQQSVCSYLQIFIRTSPHREPYYANAIAHKLLQASDDTSHLIKVARHLFPKIFKKNYPYAKAGVYLTDFTPKSQTQASLFYPQAKLEKRDRIMKCLDQVNTSWGSGTLKIGTEGTKPRWLMNRNNLSPRYTSCWHELLTVKA